MALAKPAAWRLRQAIFVQKWHVARLWSRCSSQPKVAAWRTPGLFRSPCRTLSTKTSQRDDATVEEPKKSGRDEFFETRWSTYMDELREYVAHHGDANVPVTHPRIGAWIERQRTQYRLRKSGQRSSMSDERMDQLNSVGFVWNTHQQTWEQHYEDLVAYYEKHGHSLVPNLNGSALGRWVHAQRRQYQMLMDFQPSSMTDYRLILLNKLDFIWDAHEAAWMEHYKDLCYYRECHGDW